MPTDLIANKYKIVREIARSNDIVYEAIDTTMGRRIAVKELNLAPNLTGQARRERIERFNREARAAGKLSHPNIVSVFNFGEEDGRHFIAMEYLEGSTLRDTLQARGALSVQEAVEIVSQVLQGLAHAHSYRVVHRDVKPDNIHLLPGGQVKLTDFGIARMTEEASLTSDGQVFGTPSYMSPEQIRGGAVDMRTDLFSLGIVMYEMLAGRKPFTGDNVISITHSIVHNEPPPLAGISFGIEQVVFKALAKEPTRRFANADEMRMAIRNSDQPPAMFLPRQPTNLGGSVYGSPGMGPGVPPTGQSYPAYPTAAPPPYPTAGGMGLPSGQGFPGMTGGASGTVFAPPPQSAPPANTGAGPFVNWNPNSAHLPAGYVPPPPAFPQHPSGPLISPATRTFFAWLLGSMIFAGAVVGFVIMFLNAYKQQQQKTAATAVYKILQEGETLYNAGNLEKASEKFYAAMTAGPNTVSGQNARKDLVITLNRLGTRAFEKGDLKGAETYWYRALDFDSENGDVHYNLGKLYDRLGKHDKAMEEWQYSSLAGRVGGANPAAPADNTVIQSRYEAARLLLNNGMTALNKGDVSAARDNWQRAIGEAPGTDIAQRAQELLDQTASAPNF